MQTTITGCRTLINNEGTDTLQVVDEWFVRIRGLLMRTSAAAGAAHLTLANAYARLVALAAQLRQLQRAAAAALPALAGDPAAPKLAVDSEQVRWGQPEKPVVVLRSPRPRMRSCVA